MSSNFKNRIGQGLFWSVLALIAYGPILIALFTDTELPIAYWVFGSVLLSLCVLPLPDWFWKVLGSQIWGPGIQIVLFYWTGMLGWERDNPQPVPEMLVAAVVILGGYALFHKPGSSEDDG